MKNIAIILAAGTGSRFGYKKPKQFLKLSGKLVIEHTIEIFQKHKDIDEIAIICHAHYIDLSETLVRKNNFTKVKKILVGGKERRDSSLTAIDAYKNFAGNLIFHDAVRPFVSELIITECIQQLKTYKAVNVAIPVTDTIITTKNSLIMDIPNRKKFNAGQTPQAFHARTIRAAYKLAAKDPGFLSTDDCGVVKKYLPKEKVYVVKGDSFNIKLTYEKDLHLLDKIFQTKSLELVKNNRKKYSELKNKVLVLFGGSSGIGQEIVNIAKKHGAKVYSFSRRENNTDISKKDSIKKALKKVYKHEGKVDFIINTAGILNKEPLTHMSYSSIEESVATNYLACITIAKESFEYLKKSSGSLLFFTSSSYTRGRANYSVYSSSKAAIVNFTQALSAEWDYAKVNINCLNPERTNTPMRSTNFGKEKKSTLLTPKKVAQAALKTILLPISGQIIDVKLKKNN